LAIQSTQTKQTSQHSTLKVIIIAAVIGVLAGLAGAMGYGLITRLVPAATVHQSKQVVIDEQTAVTSVAKKVSPSVVSIVSSATQIDPYSGSASLQQTGAGTGIIVSAEGLILTNKHVVNEGETFTVITSDNKEYKNAKVVAKDPSNDIAFIKVEANGLTPAELGDSDRVEVGQSVIAIGNALGQFQNSVTTGVISGKSRPITASAGSGGTEILSGLLQTDAAINPGNSGGPLVNIEGKVIGINTAVAGGAENIGFAIPINDAKADLESVRTKGKIVRAYIGVRYIPLTQQIAKQNDLPTTQGALVYGNRASVAVLPGSPAAKAGLKEGDIIVKYNGQEVTEKAPLSGYITKSKVGETVTLTILRDGKQQEVKVTLEEAPSTE
jgi:serine protease Do